MESIVTEYGKHFMWFNSSSKISQTFSNLRSLPFFVDKYEEVNKDNLTNWYKNNDISNFDIQKLDSSWWKKN